MGHLHPFRYMFTQEAGDSKPAKTYNFLIEFGLHCFTRGPSKRKGKALADYPEDLYYSDSRETRIFCFRRHCLSSRLPDIAKGIPNVPCYHTGKGNFFVIDLVDRPGVDAGGEYEVYFKVSRQQRGLLRLFIESAYIRDSAHQSSQPRKKKINFFVIAYNTQVGKVIKLPK